MSIIFVLKVVVSSTNSAAFTDSVPTVAPVFKLVLSSAVDAPHKFVARTVPCLTIFGHWNELLIPYVVFTFTSSIIWKLEICLCNIGAFS